ncbi:MAG: alpha-amylase family glycosyl hydrolase [Gemmataceae bacterium]
MARLWHRPPVAAATLLALLLCLSAPAARQADDRVPKPKATDVVVQLFNWKFTEIKDELPKLKELGYTRVHVSPPMKSHKGDQWFFRYQPVDFTKVEGPLGTSDELKELCKAANKPDVGIAIVVDCVFNHMADHPDFVTREGGKVVRLQYPRFSTADFHVDQQDVKTDTDRLKGWLGLPDLKTESTYVRGELKNYVKMLVRDYGVRGFRFDAAKHIEPEFFKEVLGVLTDAERKGLYVFGEYVTGTPSEMGDYLGTMKCYDFPLAQTMKGAFGFGGDLKRLVEPERNGEALNGPNAVTFVTHHDVAMHVIDEKERWDWIRIGGLEGGVDEKLAYAYILGRLDGTPYVYSGMTTYRKLREDDAAEKASFKRHKHRHREAPIAAGVLFHNLALGKGMSWRVKEKNQLAWQRGTDQFVAINKAGEAWKPGDLSTTLEGGEYRDLMSTKVYKVEGSGRLKGLEMPGSSAAMFVKLLAK